MKYSDLLTGYGDVLNPSDVMEILHVGRNTVYDYLGQGIIKSIRIAGKYRIPKRYLLEYIYPDMNFTELEGV